VGGGLSNTASGGTSTIGGGQSNSAIGISSTIGGGDSNSAGSLYATVAGGSNNSASTRATVGGGSGNTASGDSSMVPGGSNNQALGEHSFAAGYFAKADHNGCFVWADFSGTNNVTCDRENQLVARAYGGVKFITGSDSEGDLGTQLTPGSGSWTNISDRNKKKDIVPVDPVNIAEHIANIPMYEWSYKTEGHVRHAGPMAQDLYAEFGLGINDKTIVTIDGIGLSLTGVKGNYLINMEQDHSIKALSRQLSDLRMENKSLKAQNDELEQKNQELEERIERIEHLLRAGVRIR
jgi:hypothetical protein